MSEHKFRAWDGKWMTNFSVEIDSSGFLNLPPHPAEGMPFKVLMQSTGLKDKNGVEIYRNDIIKTEHGATGVLVWNKELLRYDFNCKEPYWSHPIYGMDGDKEVIGNIYQNPELLQSNG